MKNLFSSAKLMAAVGLMSAAAISSVTPAQAAGDLLVAPTRVIFDGSRGAEVILNNVGSEEATYRITLELRRMGANGKLADVAREDADEKENAVLGAIRYAPRRVTLPPNQPQSIRLAVRGTEELADGEYRAHMMFRAIPKTPAATAAASQATGLSIQLIPIYGVTIPIIVRKGKLSATAAISNAKMLDDAGNKVLSFDLAREGSRSVYGEIRVTKAGTAEPVVFAKGIAVYPELESRKVYLPLQPQQAAALTGPVTIGYYRPAADGGGLMSEIKTVIQ